MDKSVKNKRAVFARLNLLYLLTASLIFTPLPALSFNLTKSVTEFTLDNGLKVIYLHRPGAPIFAAHIAFKVGSVEERSGYTGTAHLLEHMMFKGTKRLGSLDWEKEAPLLAKVNKLGADLDHAKSSDPGEETVAKLSSELKEAQAEHKKFIDSEIYSKIYSSAGGVGFNAGTSKDLTTYIIRLPADKLELWAWVESERLKNSQFREFYSERDVVMEERRMRYENSPNGKLYERFLTAAYIAHPYGQPIIGWDSDISTLPLSEVERFWNAWYAPNNATIAIVGNLEIDNVKSVIKKYFGDIPKRELPSRKVTSEPAQGGRREVNVAFDAKPTMMIGFHKPTWPHKDDLVFSVIDGILAGGRTSRFEKNIVRESKVAIGVGVWTAPGSRYPNIYTISGDPRPPHTLDDLEKAIWGELEKLKTTPVNEDELRRVKTAYEADFIRGLVSHYSMARLLTYYQSVTGDWQNVVTELEEVKSVTAEDIMRVAKKYFTQDNVTVARLVEK